MKKARKSPSKSASKGDRIDDGGLAEREVVIAGPVSLSGYVQRVRRALGGRTDEYREFVDILSDLRRSQTAVDDGSTAISRLERAVSLLGGQPDLIVTLRVFLPPQYHIDVQPDAVVIKVNLHLLTVSNMHRSACSMRCTIRNV